MAVAIVAGNWHSQLEECTELVNNHVTVIKLVQVGFYAGCFNSVILQTYDHCYRTNPLD